MKFKVLFLIISVFGYASLIAGNPNQPAWLKKSVETASIQLKQMSALLHDKADKELFPRSVKDNKLKLVEGDDWTSGFFPGSLWYAYELTGDKQLLENARYFTNKLEPQQFFTGNHDIGFIMYCSYGNARRLSPQKTDSLILVNSALSLSKRFFPNVGLIRSWDNERWKFPVIIDNMMNLELLFEMSKTTGNPMFRDIAIKHADKTMENHFRSDMSSYHVVSYNPETGKAETKETHQGYSNESAWSRGQAWGVYGYTMCYRETGDEKYLTQAKAIASYIMNHPAMPEDKVPYWDYNAPKIPNEPRDASAAAVEASALLELYSITGDKKYFSFAEETLKSLSGKNYLAKAGTNHNFILMHSVGSVPGKFEVDEPLAYADYYYLEALKRYVDILNAPDRNIQKQVNSFREALMPVKKESIFKMPGYYLWDPSVVEVNGTFHLFASRWPEADGGEGWLKSEIIRATSKSLWGPYTFQEVVLSSKNHPWATKGCHNPKIVKLKDKFLLYYLGIPAWKTGFAFSKTIEGPWTVLPHPSIPTNNPALVVDKDGSAYAVGKYLIRKPGEKEITKYMQAFAAKNIDEPFRLVKDSANRLPAGCELEDPTIWKASNGYNIICTDWQARATGVWKGLIHFSSPDGVTYTLNTSKPIWDRNEPMPMADGTTMRLTKVERPEVFTDKKGRVAALLVAAEPKPKGSAFIIIRPVNNYIP